MEKQEPLARKKVIRLRKNGTKQVFVENVYPSKTDQSQAPDCDVNNIIAKFKRTGELSHIRANQGVYADVSQFTDLHTAMSEVRNAEMAFNTLPAQLRASFQNDPVKFVEFLQDPKNDEEAVRLGLKEVTNAPQRVHITNPTTFNPPTKQKNKKAPNDDELNDDDQS